MTTNLEQTKKRPISPGNKIGNRFKPGESGNPAGRPVGTKNVSTILREMLERLAPDEITNMKLVKAFVIGKKVTNADVLAACLLKLAIVDGELPAIREIIDRLDGKPKQSLDLGNENGPLTITFDFHSNAKLIENE